MHILTPECLEISPHVVCHFEHCNLISETHSGPLMAKKPWRAHIQLLFSIVSADVAKCQGIYTQNDDRVYMSHIWGWLWIRWNNDWKNVFFCPTNLPFGQLFIRTAKQLSTLRIHTPGKASRPVFYLWLSKFSANERRCYVCNVNQVIHVFRLVCPSGPHSSINCHEDNGTTFYQ